MNSYEEENEELQFLERFATSRKGIICPPSAMLSALQQGRLSQREKEILNRHVSTCPQCSHVLKTLDEHPDEGGDQCTITWDTMQKKLYPEQKVAALAAKKRYFMPMALAASIMVAFLLIWIIGKDIIPGGNPDIIRGSGTPGGSCAVNIETYGLIEQGNIQISRSRGGLPTASIAVSREKPTLTHTMDPGEYWIRFYGEKSESTWQKIEITTASGAPQKISVRAEPNIIVFQSGDSSRTLKGSQFRGEEEGNEITRTCDSDRLELGPYKKGTVIKNISLSRGDLIWKFQGSIEVKGGKQTVDVDWDK
jgi:hypothetical protein